MHYLYLISHGCSNWVFENRHKAQAEQRRTEHPLERSLFPLLTLPTVYYRKRTTQELRPLIDAKQPVEIRETLTWQLAAQWIGSLGSTLAVPSRVCRSS